MTSTACAANAVDVGVKIICSGREIKIDDVGHLSNVQSAGCYICGNQNLGNGIYDRALCLTKNCGSRGVWVSGLRFRLSTSD